MITTFSQQQNEYYEKYRHILTYLLWTLLTSHSGPACNDSQPVQAKAGRPQGTGNKGGMAEKGFIHDPCFPGDGKACLSYR
ncbi:hypothetical protein ACT5AM_001318 [Cronobacter malonaticus]